MRVGELAAEGIGEPERVSECGTHRRGVWLGEFVSASRGAWACLTSADLTFFT